MEASGAHAFFIQLLKEVALFGSNLGCFATFGRPEVDNHYIKLYILPWTYCIKGRL